ncbi:MAG TPA: DUF1573 domain-containing protein, partial [Phycisphaerales bacterium]|nr:DUF1573 domain-containing protein [Phycisphaerales bacterium]
MSRNLKLMAVAGGIVGLILSGAAAGQATTAAQPPAKPAPPVKGPETIPTVKPVPSQPQPGHGVPLTGPGVQPAATEPAPLKFAEENFSFGKIPDTQPVSHDFVFTNTANRTVTIKAANAGCGCTTPAFKDGKKTYAAGESGVMSVTFNPQGRKGAQPKNVTITFEDPAFPQQTLNFTANVVPYVSVDSSKLFFQEVRKGTPATQQMTIIGRLPGFQVLEVRGDDSMSAKVLGYEQAVDEGDPVTKATVEITVSDKLPIGNYTTNFTVKTNDERQPEVHFYGSANVVGELRPNMPGIVIRVNDPSKEFTSEIVIDTRSGTQFEITDL